MKIFIIKSSPHKHGSSNLLADRFIQGAMESGHEVETFDAGRAKLHPCLGCDVCKMTTHMYGPCCQADDMVRVRESLLDSDMVVFVTPLYYFGMSAQLKMVIDRFCSFNGPLTEKGLKAALITASFDSNDWTMDALVSHYRTLCRYLHLDNQGMILGVGCGTVKTTEDTEFPQRAYEFGKDL